MSVSQDSERVLDAPMPPSMAEQWLLIAAQCTHPATEHFACLQMVHWSQLEGVDAESLVRAGARTPVFLIEEPQPAAAMVLPAVAPIEPPPLPQVPTPAPIEAVPAAEPELDLEARADTEPGRHFRRPSWSTIGLVVFVLLMAGVTGAALIKSPYVAFTPGSTRDARSELRLNGSQLPEGTGSIQVVVVRFKQLSWLELLVRRKQKIADVVGVDQSDNFRLSAIGGDVHRNSIGYASREAHEEADEPFRYLGSGLLVRGVIFDTPARALYPKQIRSGDIVTELNGKPMRTVVDAQRVLARLRAGDPIHVKTQRGTEFDVTAQTKIGDDDATGTTKVSGLVLDTWDARTKSKFDFSSPVKDVQGTSAGFAYALAMYQAISGEDLERGRKIVVTGSIEEESGDILTVDGVRQKVIAAREVGADVILVSTHDISTAAPYAGDALLLAPKNLHEAIAMLRSGAPASQKPVPDEGNKN